MLLEFFYSFFGLSSFNGLWTIDFLFDFSSHKGNSLIIIHELKAFLHFVFFLLIISLLVSLQDLLDSVEGKIDVISSFIKSLKAVHYFEQVFNVFIDGFVSCIDVLLRAVQEFGDLLELVVDICDH